MASPRVDVMLPALHSCTLQPPCVPSLPASIQCGKQMSGTAGMHILNPGQEQSSPATSWHHREAKP